MYQVVLLVYMYNNYRVCLHDVSVHVYTMHVHVYV